MRLWLSDGTTYKQLKHGNSLMIEREYQFNENLCFPPTFPGTFCLFCCHPQRRQVPAIHVCNNHLPVIWFLKLSFESKFVEIKLKFAETWRSSPPKSKVGRKTKVLSSVFHFPIVPKSVSTRLSKRTFCPLEFSAAAIRTNKAPTFFYFTFIQFFGILCDSFDSINRLPLQFLFRSDLTYSFVNLRR